MTATVGGLRRSARRVAGRGILGLLVAALLAVGVAWGVSASSGRAASFPETVTPADSPGAFLAGYEQPDGRVVRRDQGGDTVSEGQAYAMLVAAAIGDRARFAAAWTWASAHLLEPDGLLAWHWQDGVVTGAEPAADADVGAAAGLVSASIRWRDPSYLAAARRLAAAVVAHETVPTATGPVLAAGPWATTQPPRVDPSYLSPEELGVLAAALGGPWPALAASADRQLQALTAGGTLPSDWAVVGSDGAVHPASPPGTPSAPVRYGFDAARAPIWLAGACLPAYRAAAAGLLPALRRGGGQLELDLGGKPSPGLPSPVGTLALAAATAASGDQPAAAALEAKAAAADRAHPTYYGAAWLALTTLTLDHRLETCP
ncbi:hypothetical protein K6U06_18090 [Acidiferrimicrobium sp. IK]|uniref:glycosyl hydrolase family 8 n=1 Tax=Acidiferrimicrobium sp. IK TaxID=2871700 RepID=UPI0021CB7BA9|nr:glycosyl hydrolase family 8 [Acidiferrimicrobium sp. IK]MCU4186282.1 hypothetical protein [Acidiferrimicrobium sp. IK]